MISGYENAKVVFVLLMLARALGLGLWLLALNLAYCDVQRIIPLSGPVLAVSDTRFTLEQPYLRTVALALRVDALGI